jgi:hypothetical protein
MVFLRTVEWCPHGLSDEKTHSMNYAFFVACEPCSKRTRGMSHPVLLNAKMVSSNQKV